MLSFEGGAGAGGWAVDEKRQSLLYLQSLSAIFETEEWMSPGPARRQVIAGRQRGAALERGV